MYILPTAIADLLTTDTATMRSLRDDVNDHRVLPLTVIVCAATRPGRDVSLQSVTVGSESPINIQ